MPHNEFIVSVQLQCLWSFSLSFSVELKQLLSFYCRKFPLTAKYAHKNAECETIESKHEMLTKKLHIVFAAFHITIWNYFQIFKRHLNTFTYTHRTYVCNLISVFLPAFIYCWLLLLLLLFNIGIFEHTAERERKKSGETPYQSID